MRKSSFLLVLLAGVIWGLMGIFVRRLNGSGLSAIEILQFRITPACAVIGIYLLFKDRSALRVAVKDLWCFFGTGILSLLFFSYCYFSGMTEASLSVMSVLLYTSPAFVMLMSVLFFKEKMTAVKAAALVLNLAGCCLVSGLGPGASLSTKGLLLGLGSGFGYALYSIFSRCAINRGYSSWTITFYTFLFCALGALFLSDKKIMAEAVMAEPSLWSWILIMAVTTGFLAYLFYTKGLEGMPSSLAAIVVSIEPVTATVVGTVLFREKLTVMMVVGIILMIAGIAVMSRGSEAPEEPGAAMVRKRGEKL